MAAHDAISLTTATPSSSISSPSSSSSVSSSSLKPFRSHSRSMAAMRAATPSLRSAAAVVFATARASAMNLAAAAATCGDSAAAAAGNACRWQNCLIAPSFAARPLCACADASAAASWKSPKYFEAPSAASAAGAAYVATAPAAAADLPTFSIFSFGASAKMASTTSFSANSPGVGGGALPSPSSPSFLVSFLVSFLCFLAGGSAPSPAGPLVVTSACANSSAAPLAVTPDDPPPSASASSMASAIAASPTALTRAYSSGSSARRSSSRARKFAWGTTHWRMRSLSAETRWASSRAKSVSPAHAASLVGSGSLVAERTDSRHAKASATAASAASAVGSSTPATPTHAPTMERNADESSIDAWRVTRALANRNARFAAIQSSSDAVPSSDELRRMSVDREIDPTIDRVASPRRASGMYARTARNTTLSAARLTLASSLPHIGTTCGAMTFPQSVSRASGAASLAVAASRKY